MRKDSNLSLKSLIGDVNIDRKDAIEYIANSNNLEIKESMEFDSSFKGKLNDDFLNHIKNNNVKDILVLDDKNKDAFIERWLVKSVDNNGCIKLKSPITGEVLESRHSVGLNIFYFKENGRVILLSFISRISYGFTEFQITIPSLGLIVRCILTTKDRAKEAQEREIYIRLGTLLFDFVSNRRVFKRYLKNPIKNYFLVNTDHQHIGHGLWNGLSGWSRFLDLNLQRFEKLMSSSAYFVNSSLLQPNWKVKFLERSYKPMSAISGSDFVFYLKSRYISKDIAGLLKNSAVSRVNKIYPSKLVIMNLRLGNREQINTKEFYFEVIKSVLSKDDSVHFYIDGMNTDSSREQAHTHQAIELDKEVEMAEFLVNSFPENVKSLVGCSVSENISAIANSKVAIAPWGAGLAKLSWICNLPVIVLSSLTVRDRKDDFNIYQDPACREMAVGHFLVSKDYITDYPNKNATGDVYKLNFEVDLKAVPECVDVILTHTSK